MKWKKVEKGHYVNEQGCHIISGKPKWYIWNPRENGVFSQHRTPFPTLKAAKEFVERKQWRPFNV